MPSSQSGVSSVVSSVGGPGGAGRSRQGPPFPWWISLKDFKEASPVEVAEYALRNQLIEEPAFKWWASHVLKKRKRILSAMKRRYFRTHTKCGVELPKTVERALEIDKETGTTFWADAIAKEMKTVFVAFEILPEDKMAPRGH